MMSVFYLPASHPLVSGDAASAMALANDTRLTMHLDKHSLEFNGLDRPLRSFPIECSPAPSRTLRGDRSREEHHEFVHQIGWDSAATRRLAIEVRTRDRGSP